MDTNTLTKAQKEQYWYQHIKEWEQSGISKKAYCRQHNIVYDQFKWWYRKIQEKGIKNETGFIAIEKLSTRQDTAGKINIVIGGIRIEVQSGVDEQVLKKVLRTAQEVAVCR